ncbi:hypothetical protein QP794_22335 [Paenibacillus sp. UMB7766-LJ446]|uniref:hypothetical protein n=1 Tax=Paenibacillus sp. UMB7766-LJ446 TaxID=3046313 RepID=UPI00254B7CC0|nr:hypothetical protein [Paenibacillus sp. UMB7766-LJ446]MDK8192828.1 hypothetical protein [Paenibacillus sp. UMB7766-LJ446]
MFVQVEPHFPDSRLVGGKYHMGSHTVYLYKKEIMEQCQMLFGSLAPLKAYIYVILAHELGHAEDVELVDLSNLLHGPHTAPEQAEIRLRIEENAWRYAESLLFDIDPIFLRTIIDESLYSYRQAIEPHIA